MKRKNREAQKQVIERVHTLVDDTRLRDNPDRVIHRDCSAS